jgi:uncharacterized membrane protein
MHQRISRIERELENLEQQDTNIKNDLENLHKELIEKAPELFSKRDLLRAFLGSLFLGFSVLFSSNLLNVAKILPERHVYVILFFTFIVLSSEIYFIGYSRVPDKDKRPFMQFWLKRLLAFYFVAFAVSFILMYIFGLIYLIDTPAQFINAIIILTTPTAIGASIGDLIKKY